MAAFEGVQYARVDAAQAVDPEEDDQVQFARPELYEGVYDCIAPEPPADH